jgi:hypothetical protein
MKRDDEIMNLVHQESDRREIIRLKKALDLALKIIGNSSVRHITGEHINNVNELNKLLADTFLEERPQVMQ